MSSPVFGRVAWASIPDSRGRAPKRRPVVIVSLTDDIIATGMVRVVGVTTKADLATPGEQTELMFDPAGSCRTGLRERCWAVSTWLALVSVDDIEAYAGTVPGRTMAEILGKMPKPDG